MVSKVKVSYDNLFRVIDDESESIHVNRDQSRSIGGKHQSLDIAPVLERQSPRNVANLQKSVYLYKKDSLNTYLVRSKAVTLLPTGDKRIWSLVSLPEAEFFSVKRMLPLV